MGRAKLSSITRDISEFAACRLIGIWYVSYYSGSVLKTAMALGSHLISKLKRPAPPISFEKLHDCHLKGT